MMTELQLRLTGWWLTAMVSDSCHPPWLHCRGPPKELFQLSTLASPSLHTRTCWLPASAGQRGTTPLTASLLMTAATMVDGRRRTPPVTLIHATAVPAGWLLAKVLTVGISSPKWHLKCEVMAVLVAQAPQAGPRTRALALLPSLDIEVIDPRAKSDPVTCSTKLTGVIEIGESDLRVGCLIWNFSCSSHRWQKICTSQFY